MEVLFICMTDKGCYIEPKTWLGDNFALSHNKYPCLLTMALTLLRDFEGVVGAKKTKGTSSNNNDLLHGAGVTIANASNKPIAERKCFGCGRCI